MEDRHLCKAKRKDNEEWVEGYIAHCPTGEWEILRKCDNPPDGDPMWRKVLITHVVDPSKICACTGLKDKNGKLIWENDILVGHLDDDFPEDTTYTMVVWHKNGFCTKNHGSEDVLALDEFDQEHFEVCGNWFDNPELLEVEYGRE